MEWLRVPVAELPEWCSIVKDEAKRLKDELNKKK